MEGSCAAELTVVRLRARAAAPEALADEAEVTVRGEMP
jgi:hypothetical protein